MTSTPPLERFSDPFVLSLAIQPVILSEAKDLALLILRKENHNELCGGRGAGFSGPFAGPSVAGCTHIEPSLVPRLRLGTPCPLGLSMAFEPRTPPAAMGQAGSLEMAAAFKDHFSEQATEYAKHRPRYPDRLFDWLVSLVQDRQQAWDCATGNGQAAYALASRFERVIATDASEAQIKCAETHPRVIYRIAPAEESGIAAQSVDLVTVAQAAHWFDIEKFYQEVKRVTKPSSVLAVWCYDLFRVSPEIDDLIHDFYVNVVGPYWPAERKWVEDNYRSLPFPFEEIRVPSFEMTTQWSLQAVLDYLRTWSAARKYLQEKGSDSIELIHDPLEQAWGESKHLKNIAWTLHLRVGRV